MTYIIRYSKECEFDLYAGSRSGPVLVFVHGGAWKSEDKTEHADLARSLVAATGCPVAVPNYRLTPAGNTDPRLRHPMHAQDLLAFLHFLHAWPDPPCALDTSRLLLIGHSCSAHMLASIFLTSPDPSLAPAPALLAAVKAIVLSEGIYDLDALLERFPAYRAWFVESAFGPAPDYAEFNVTCLAPRPDADIAWLLLHSRGDTLVDTAQTERMHRHLAALDPQCVALNVDDLDDEHNDVLRSKAYVNLLGAFAARVFDFTV